MTLEQNNNDKEKISAPSRATELPRARPQGRRHGPMALMPGERARNFKQSMRLLIQYLGKYRLLLLLVMLVAAAGTVFAIFGPKLLGSATTELYAGVQRMMRGDPKGSTSL